MSFDGCDHANDYWPYEREEGFCPKCKKHSGERPFKKCKRCGHMEE